MTAPKSCKKCGEVHERCTAHTRAGNPCRQQPMAGQGVCRMHGGSAPQSLAAAEERIVSEKADAEIAKLWPGLAGQTPIKDPVDLLARTAAALEAMTETVGERINQNSTSIAAGKDMTQLRAEIVLLDRLLDKLLKASEGMARLGIAERHVELERERAEMVTAAFLAAIGVIQLLPADRDLVVRTFLDRLSSAVALPAAAGQEVS